MSAAEDRLGGWLSPFSGLFTSPSWRRVVVLVTGALLTPHRRTVSSALGATGRAQAKDFARYHAVLNRNRWSALAVVKVLLGLLVTRFPVGGPVIIGMNDTPAAAAAGRAAITIVLPGGSTVSIDPDASPALIKATLRALR